MIIQNTIHIDSPPEVVWPVTIDIDRWSEWTPTVKSAKREDEGPLSVGSTAILSQPSMPEARWAVTSSPSALRRRQSFAGWAPPTRLVSETGRPGNLRPGVHHEAGLYTRPWGFRLQDITADVHLWHENRMKMSQSQSAATLPMPFRTATPGSLITRDISLCRTTICESI